MSETEPVCEECERLRLLVSELQTAINQIYCAILVPRKITLVPRIKPNGDVEYDSGHGDNNGR